MKPCVGLSRKAFNPLRPCPSIFQMKPFLRLIGVILALSLPPAFAEAAFAKKLVGEGFSLEVSSPNEEGSNTLTIRPTGLQSDNSPVERPVAGVVTHVELKDLDGDGAPELLVWLSHPGSSDFGELAAFSTNHRKSLSDIFIELPEKSDLAGYRGRDEFEVVENTFVRRFPVYLDGDKDADPTGGMRQFQYKLQKGEAGWLLKLDQVVSY